MWLKRKCPPKAVDQPATLGDLSLAKSSGRRWIEIGRTIRKFTLVAEVKVEVMAGGGLQINRVGVASNLLADMKKVKTVWVMVAHHWWGWEVCVRVRVCQRQGEARRVCQEQESVM